ncbi:hypothetical protein DFH07DRAFT_770482 [Mycena maculata]|uniref:Uncharacterized protein n=1 Tax=Mycena maculata TaxID=230809 RepID=A0AAD7JGW4_9AGAR|nr:hypothetical protein DFH07DRAFT_770482 [Mycena maculata]
MYEDLGDDFVGQGGSLAHESELLNFRREPDQLQGKRGVGDHSISACGVIEDGAEGLLNVNFGSTGNKPTHRSIPGSVCEYWLLVYYYIEWKRLINGGCRSELQRALPPSPLEFLLVPCVGQILHHGGHIGDTAAGLHVHGLFGWVANYLVLCLCWVAARRISTVGLTLMSAIILKQSTALWLYGSTGYGAHCRGVMFTVLWPYWAHYRSLYQPWGVFQMKTQLDNPTTVKPGSSESECESSSLPDPDSDSEYSTVTVTMGSVALPKPRQVTVTTRIRFTTKMRPLLHFWVAEILTVTVKIWLVALPKPPGYVTVDCMVATIQHQCSKRADRVRAQEHLFNPKPPQHGESEHTYDYNPQLQSRQSPVPLPCIVHGKETQVAAHEVGHLGEHCRTVLRIKAVHGQRCQLGPRELRRQRAVDSLQRGAMRAQIEMLPVGGMGHKCPQKWCNVPPGLGVVICAGTEHDLPPLSTYLAQQNGRPGIEYRQAFWIDGKRIAEDFCHDFVGRRVGPAPNSLLERPEGISLAQKSQMLSLQREHSPLPEALTPQQVFGVCLKRQSVSSLQLMKICAE